MASLKFLTPNNGFENKQKLRPIHSNLNNSFARKSRVDARGHFYLKKKMEALEIPSAAPPTTKGFNQQNPIQV